VLGARVVGISFDLAGAMADFLEGWDDGAHMHGRPADVTVSDDGRLFIANDTTGEIFWVAPLAR
jgi:glucose/arabinose dehydrogenase